MKKVTSRSAVDAGAPGSFWIENAKEGDQEFRRLWAKLPDSTVGGFALEPAPAEIPGIWTWNGSEKKPTLWRTIRGVKTGVTMRGRWCGQIKAGRMVSDSAPAISAANRARRHG